MSSKYPPVPPTSWSMVDSQARNTLLHLYNNRFEDFLRPKAMFKLFAGGLRDSLGIGYGVETLPFGEEGYFDFRTNEIILSEETYSDLEDDGGRARFTVGHEIGHAILHSAHMHELSRSPDRVQVRLNRSQIPPYRDPECQANRFAAEFLMPTPFIQYLMDTGCKTEDIAQICRVSYSAAKNKVATLSKNK